MRMLAVGSSRQYGLFIVFTSAGNSKKVLSSFISFTSVAMLSKVNCPLSTIDLSGNELELDRNSYQFPNL
jgi:hypothetical protein